jgi:phosphatidylserine/phosphatidylglycerophosphate/cardiolipin synthase-like enzyme
VLGTLAQAAPADSIGLSLGKWKLDPAHSRLTDQMKVESGGPNKFNLNFSGDNVETIVADGTDQPGLFGTTVAIIVQDASNWKVVRKTNGRTTIIGLWQLSPDGKTLTDNFTGYRDNGTTSNLHYIYQRIAGPAAEAKASGFVGTWESTTEDVNSTQEVEVKPFQDDGLSFINAGGQVVQSLHFDGKDYPGSGSGAPQGYTSSGHRINDRAIDRIDKVNGKTLYAQQIEVSADGKILTMTVHIPGRDKPDIMVFNRE